MKFKIICAVAAMLLSLSSKAQTVSETTQTVTEEPKKNVREIDVYRDVDVLASYRGGYKVVLNKIEGALKNCKKGKFKGKDATLVIDILISDKGKVVKVDFVKSPTELCKNDIKDAVEKSDQWIPAKVNNKPVYSYVTLTVNLKNENRY